MLMLTSWVMQFLNHSLRSYMFTLHVLSSSTCAKAVMFQASDSNNMFDDNVTTPSADTITSLHDEIEHYLSTKPDPSMKDVFAWWRVHSSANHRYTLKCCGMLHSSIAL